MGERTQVNGWTLGKVLFIQQQHHFFSLSPSHAGFVLMMGIFIDGKPVVSQISIANP